MPRVLHSIISFLPPCAKFGPWLSCLELLNHIENIFEIWKKDVFCNWTICFLFLLDSNSIFIAWWAILLITVTNFFFRVPTICQTICLCVPHINRMLATLPDGPRLPRLVNASGIFYIGSLFQSHSLTLHNTATHCEQVASPLFKSRKRLQN